MVKTWPFQGLSDLHLGNQSRSLWITWWLCYSGTSQLFILKMALNEKLKQQNASPFRCFSVNKSWYTSHVFMTTSPYQALNSWRWEVSMKNSFITINSNINLSPQWRPESENIVVMTSKDHPIVGHHHHHHHHRQTSPLWKLAFRVLWEMLSPPRMCLA